METRARILVVEDEAAIRDGLTDVLVYHGYNVDAVADGREGLAKALSGRYDLVLLDVMLPGCDGFSICDEVRKADRDQPIIMLTAKTSDTDIVNGLALGADDYVAKPFSIAQLVLRIKAVLRRARPALDAQTHIRLDGDVEIDTCNLSGRRGSEHFAFTRREIEILKYLHANAARPVSREELLTRVWGYDRGVEIETRTVDIHIAKLRRKVEVDPKAPCNLVTVRGAGYKLIASGAGVSEYTSLAHAEASDAGAKPSDSDAEPSVTDAEANVTDAEPSAADVESSAILATTSTGDAP